MLDRFLISDHLIDKLGLKGQFVGDRSISDHLPIWIKSNKLNWGPKSFKLFSFWMDHPDFVPIIEKDWNSFNSHGKKMFIFKEKLKLLKSSLKLWNSEFFLGIWT